MSTQATISDFYTTSTTPGTAVVLGASTIKLSTCTLQGYKAAGTANTGAVKWRPVGGTGWTAIASAASSTVPIPTGSFLRASQIEIDVVSSGDGVRAEYTAAVVYEGP